MKKNLFKRGVAGLLSLVMCLTALVGFGTTTAFAAGEQADVYLISFSEKWRCESRLQRLLGTLQSPVYERLVLRQFQVHHHTSDALV